MKRIIFLLLFLIFLNNVIGQNNECSIDTDCPDIDEFYCAGVLRGDEIIPNVCHTRVIQSCENKLCVISDYNYLPCSPDLCYYGCVEEVELNTANCIDSKEFIRGNINGDEIVDLSDSLYLFNYLFLGGGIPDCKKAADVNDNGKIDITDGIYLLNFLFLGGPAPPMPFPEEGVDTTEDELTCLA